MDFRVRFLELDHNDDLTGNTIIEFVVKGNSKIAAIHAAVKQFKTESRNLYLEYRHSYFIKAEQI